MTIKINLLFRSSNFLIVSLMFYMYNTMSAANSEFYFFLSSVCSCISLSSLIAMARTSKTMLNSSGQSGHPCLVPEFGGNVLNFSPLRIMFAVGLSYMTFIMLSYAPSMPTFWKVFYHK